MDVVCEICGRTFEAKTTRARYCTRCQKIAAKITRAKWEEKTNFKAKRNAKRNAERAAKRAEKARQKSAEVELVQAGREERAELLREQYIGELTKRAESGDAFAMMHLAMMNGDVYLYWKCRAQCERKEAQRFGKASANVVGGVSLSDPQAAEKIMFEINKGG